MLLSQYLEVLSVVFTDLTSSPSPFLFSFLKFHRVFACVYLRRLRLAKKIYAFCTIQQALQGYCACRDQSSISRSREICQAQFPKPDWKRMLVNSSLYWVKISAMALASGELDLIVCLVWLTQLSLFPRSDRF